MKNNILSLLIIAVLVSCGANTEKPVSVSKPKSNLSTSYPTQKPSQAEIDKMVKSQMEYSFSSTNEKSGGSSSTKVHTNKEDTQKKTETQNKLVNPTTNVTQNKSPETTNTNSDGFKTYEKDFKKEIEYIGNSKTMKFHFKDCDSVEKIAPGNVVIFKSLEEALKKGFVPCRRCNPR